MTVVRRPRDGRAVGTLSPPEHHVALPGHDGLDGKVQREKGSAEGRGATAYDCRSSPLNVPAFTPVGQELEERTGPFP